MRDELEGYDLEKLGEKYPCVPRYDDGVLDLEAVEFSDLANILEESHIGEFVQYTVDWSIKEQKLDTFRVARPKKKRKK